MSAGISPGKYTSPSLLEDFVLRPTPTLNLLPSLAVHVPSTSAKFEDCVKYMISQSMKSTDFPDLYKMCECMLTLAKPSQLQGVRNGRDGWI
jgi:hypothetical protein